jgi:hypothetical protein
VQKHYINATLLLLETTVVCQVNLNKKYLKNSESYCLIQFRRIETDAFLVSQFSKSERDKIKGWKAAQALLL